MLPAPFDTLDSALAERRTVRAGEVLFREGDPARGDRVVIHSVRAGESFAEASLFAATIGLSHEAVYRALRRLVRAGRVRQEGRGRCRVL